MDPNKDSLMIEEKVKRLLASPPEYKLSDEKRRELISKIYSIEEEKRSIVEFIPFKLPEPVYVGALATLLLVFGFVYMFSPLLPVVEKVSGTVKVYRLAKNQWISVEDKRVKIHKGDIVKTLEGSKADIIKPKMYHLRLKGDSELKLAYAGRRALSGNVQYDLAKGKVFSYYRKTKNGQKLFRINTPQASTSVLGTDFMVKVTPKRDITWVGVLDGVVKVIGKDLPKKAKDESVLVEAGERVTVRYGETPSRPQRLMENELLELEELYRIGTKPQVALLISTGKNRVRELLSGTPLYISSEKEHVLSEKMEKIAKIFRQAIKEKSKEKHLDNIREFENIVNNYPDTKYDVQLLLFIGAYYEYLDENKMAIETFRKIIDKYPKSNLLSIAQCAIGVIFEEKLHDYSKAKDAYEKVIANYPRSPEIYEAEIGLERLKKPR